MNRLNSVARRVAKWGLRRSIWRDAVYRPSLADRPHYIRLDVTNYCNQLCIKCFVPAAMRREPAHAMALEDYRALAEKLFPYAYLLQLPCAYEGLMHPRFPDLIRIADQYKIPNIGIVTNGVLLKGERAGALLESSNVTAVSVSIDALAEDVYRVMRGRPGAAAVLDNVARFIELKRRGGRRNLHLKFNVLIARSNAADLPALTRWAVDHGVDEIEFFHVEPMSEDNEELLLNEPGAYDRLHEELGMILAGTGLRVYLPPPDGSGAAAPSRHTQDEPGSRFDTSESNALDPRYSHPYPTHTFCINPWMVLQIDSRGDMYPCGHRLHLGPFANILRQERDEALNSFAIMRLRHEHLTGRVDEECHRCRSRTPCADPMRRRQVRMLTEDLERIAMDEKPF